MMRNVSNRNGKKRHGKTVWDMFPQGRSEKPLMVATSLMGGKNKMLKQVAEQEKPVLQPPYVEEEVEMKNLCSVAATCSCRTCPNYPDKALPLCHVYPSTCGLCPIFWENYPALFEFKREIKQIEFSHQTIVIAIKMK